MHSVKPPNEQQASPQKSYLSSRHEPFFHFMSRVNVVCYVSQVKTGDEKIQTKERIKPKDLSLNLSLKEWMKSTHDLLFAQVKPANPVRRINIKIVMGNEAADMDSVVSALTYAYGMTRMTANAANAAAAAVDITRNDADDSNEIWVPLVNVQSSELILRADIIHLFEQQSLTIADLTFIDQIDLEVLAKLPNVEFCLVDHNRLADHQSSALLASKVVRIVDHHLDEKLYLDSAPAASAKRNIQTVGSCASLVALEVMQNKQFIISNTSSDDVVLCSLLASTILMDTGNFDPKKKKATPTDRTAFNELNKILKWNDQQTLSQFKTLKKKRNDCSSFTNDLLLRKDVKFGSSVVPLNGMSGGQKISFAVCSIPWPLTQWWSRGSSESANNPMLVDAMEEFLRKHQLSFLAIMTSGKLKISNDDPAYSNVPNDQKEKGIPIDAATKNKQDKEKIANKEAKKEAVRHLLIHYSQSSPSLVAVMKHVCEHLERKTDAQLKPIPFAPSKNSQNNQNNQHNQDVVKCYQQLNISASRKQIFPYIRDALSLFQ